MSDEATPDWERARLWLAHSGKGFDGGDITSLALAISAARRAEREACARIAENPAQWTSPVGPGTRDRDRIAAAIRDRNP